MTSTPPSHLRADCSRCCGLCCVAPAFFKDQGFAIDKPAGTSCRHLRADELCAIHDELRTRGFPACASFDCYGAGQRVTQQLFGGASWRASPEIAAKMFEAYARYRTLHELLALLELASRRAADAEANALAEIAARIEELCATGGALADSVRIEPLREEVLSRARQALAPTASSVERPLELGQH